MRIRHLRTHNQTDRQSEKGSKVGKQISQQLFILSIEARAHTRPRMWTGPAAILNDVCRALFANGFWYFGSFDKQTLQT